MHNVAFEISTFPSLQVEVLDRIGGSWEVARISAAFDFASTHHKVPPLLSENCRLRILAPLLFLDLTMCRLFYKRLFLCWLSCSMLLIKQAIKQSSCSFSETSSSEASHRASHQQLSCSIWLAVMQSSSVLTAGLSSLLSN